jgi:hypothetical protein
VVAAGEVEGVDGVAAAEDVEEEAVVGISTMRTPLAVVPVVVSAGAFMEGASDTSSSSSPVPTSHANQAAFSSSRCINSIHKASTCNLRCISSVKRWAWPHHMLPQEEEEEEGVERA